MFNFGWAEMLVIGVVALIVIGPEDLPDMFRQMGRFTAKLRSMSREFSRAMEQAAKDTGVKDVAKDLRNVASTKALGLDAVKSAADKFEKWDPIKNAANPTMTAKPLVPPPMPATPAPVTPVPITSVPVVLTTQADALIVDDAAEAADDLAEHAEVTQVNGTYDKQAARDAVLREQEAKLRAIDDGTYVPAPAILRPDPDAPPPVAKRVRKPKAEVVVDAPVAARSPRKSTKKADKA